MTHEQIKKMLEMGIGIFMLLICLTNAYALQTSLESSITLYQKTMKSTAIHPTEVGLEPINSIEAHTSDAIMRWRLEDNVPTNVIFKYRKSIEQPFAVINHDVFKALLNTKCLVDVIFVLNENRELIEIRFTETKPKVRR